MYLSEDLEGAMGKMTKLSEVSSFVIADGTAAAFRSLSWTRNICLSRPEDLIKEIEINDVGEKCGWGIW